MKYRWYGPTETLFDQFTGPWGEVAEDIYFYPVQGSIASAAFFSQAVASVTGHASFNLPWPASFSAATDLSVQAIGAARVAAGATSGIVSTLVGVGAARVGSNFLSASVSTVTAEGRSVAASLFSAQNVLTAQAVGVGINSSQFSVDISANMYGVGAATYGSWFYGQSILAETIETASIASAYFESDAIAELYGHPASEIRQASFGSRCRLNDRMLYTLVVKSAFKGGTMNRVVVDTVVERVTETVYETQTVIRKVYVNAPTTPTEPVRSGRQQQTILTSRG